MNCILHINPICLTWKDGDVHILLERKDGSDLYRLPHRTLTVEHASPLECVQDAMKALTVDQSRIHFEHQPIVTQWDGQDASELNAHIPFLVLTPPDVIKQNEDIKLLPLDLVEQTKSEVDKKILETARQTLVRLIGSTSACLNMLPAFFSNVEIKLIHNKVLNGYVNRMTLRKRYEDTGLVKSTGMRIQVQHGRQPQEMTPMIDEIHHFSSMISTNATE